MSAVCVECCVSIICMFKGRCGGKSKQRSIPKGHEEEGEGGEMSAVCVECCVYDKCLLNVFCIFVKYVCR